MLTTQLYYNANDTSGHFLTKSTTELANLIIGEVELARLLHFTKTIGTRQHGMKKYTPIPRNTSRKKSL